ncbi:MAG: tetratricopeptide repeat protein [Terriglobia bacterium]
MGRIVGPAGVVMTLFLFLSGGLAAPQQAGRAAPAGSAATTAPDHAGSYYHFMLARRYEELAGIYNRTDYLNRAISEFKEAIADDPDSLFLHVQLGDLYWRAGRASDAMSEAHQVLKANPNDLDAHRLLANVYLHELGKNQSPQAQQQILGKAIGEYEAIIRTDPSDTRSTIMLGRLYGLDNQAAKAEETFKKVLANNPDSTTALNYLGKLYIDQEQYPAAISFLEKIPQAQRGPSTLGMLGLAYSETGDYTHAVADFKAALEMDPENVDVRHQYADALMRSGNIKEARSEFEKVLQVNPQDGTAYLRLAQIDQAAGNFDAAGKELSQAGKLLPGDLEVAFQEALLQNALGNSDKASQILERLLAQTKSANGHYSGGDASNRATFLERLGLIYRSQEKYDQAITTFRQIIDLGEAQAPRGEGLVVETLRLEGKPQQALQEATNALAKYPKSRSLILLHATLLGEQGHVNEAVNRLRDLLKTSGGHDAQVELAIVQVYSQAKRYRAAQAVLEKLLQQPDLSSSNRETAQFFLGSVYEREKKYDLAERQFKSVLAADPLNSAAFNYLGYMMADRGVKLDQSVEYIKKALQLEPNNAAYLDSLGWAYYKMARYDLARSPLEKAAKLLSNDPTVLEHLGHLYLKMGNQTGAAAEWKRALREWPNSSDTDFGPAQASKLRKRLSQLERRLAKEQKM